MMTHDVDTPWRGRFIEVRQRGTWEYVTRPNGVRAAVIVAVDDGHVLLIEQFRVPLGRRTLELPAGLVGDEQVGEAAEVAAVRELEEETGYRPDTIVPLGDFVTTPGMSDESFTLFRATGLTRVGEGGGVEGEDIVVHRVALDGLADFVAERRAAGLAIDVKLLLLLGGGMLAR